MSNIYEENIVSFLLDSLTDTKRKKDNTWQNIFSYVSGALHIHL